MNDKIFFLKCRHGDFCSSVTFHNKNETGYGTDLSNLELYTLESAQKALGYDIKSIPLLASEVMKLAKLRVDHQYLDGTKGHPVNMDDLCVIQIDGCWDGNDIKFKNEMFGTYNLEAAGVISYQAAIGYCNKENTIWLKSYLDSISRPTFQK